jgi:nucleoside 2-deoxyribosyltransferase|tara:strand:- start:178 stop:588 length:411 start_codon:yes stop_codon:yes gene_type:complete
MKVFITASFKEGKNKDEIENLCSLIKKSGFEDFCFIRDVENYQKIFDDPRELMDRAKEEIVKSDVLLIDMTHKPTGRAIEAGIAFAQNKKIISIMKKGTKIKNTTRGISDAVIEYEDIKEIVIPLNSLFNEWNGNK